MLSWFLRQNLIHRTWSMRRNAAPDCLKGGQGPYGSTDFQRDAFHLLSQPLWVQRGPSLISFGRRKTPHQCIKRLTDSYSVAIPYLSSLSVAGGTHSKCSGCGLQRFPSIFSRNLTRLGNAVEWRFSDCYRVFSQKEMKTWVLEFVHSLVMAKGGTSWRCSCCNCSSPKKTFQKTAQTHKNPYPAPLNSYGNTMGVDLVCIGLRREPWSGQ